MLNDIHSDLIRGHVPTIIMKALLEGDRYGYDICQEIQAKSNGQYTLKQPTLYGALRRLEEQGYVTSYWGTTSTRGGRRRYYTLTPVGRDLVLKSTTEWEYSRSVIDSLISNRDFDLSALPPVEETKRKRTKQSSSKEEDDFEENEEEEEEELDDEEAEQEIKPQAAPKPQQKAEPVQVKTEQEAEEISLAASELALSQQPIEPQPVQNQFRYFGTQQESSQSYAQKLSEQKIQITQVVKRPPINESFYFQQPQPFAQPTEHVQQQQVVQIPQPQPSQVAQQQSTEQQQTHNAPPSEQPQEAPKSFYQGADYYSPQYVAEEIARIESNEDLLKKEYKTVLSRLFGKHDMIVPVGGDVKKIDYKKPMQPHEKSPEEITVKAHNKDTASEFENKFYYFSSKLRLVHFGILFFIMLLEVALTFLVIKFGLNLTQENEALVYILALVASAVLPISAGIIYLKNPDKKAILKQDSQSILLGRSLLMLNTFIATAFINLWIFRAQVYTPSVYIVSLVLPCVLATNLPLSCLIFSALYKTKKFNA